MTTATLLRSIVDTYGCRTHAVSTDTVARWWSAVERDQPDVGMCTCCTAPCPPSWPTEWRPGGNPMSLCKRCDMLTREAM